MIFMADNYNINYISPFWDNEFKTLFYEKETFNDPVSVKRWLSMGYADNFTGFMCDMRRPQPSWNDKIIKVFADKGWKDIGTSYYRMDSGVVLPTHKDLYKKYVELFDLVGKEKTIKRAVLFLEDWKSGHYAEYDGIPFTQWQAGNYVEWEYDMPHMAANIGTAPRYTLQITGHV